MTLRIAVEPDESAWRELTVPQDDVPLHRIRVNGLGDAAQATARSTRPVFVDIDVVVADSVGAAFAEYRARNPGWSPGAHVGTIVHPGTASTLARLLSDIDAARVADGVTLRGPLEHDLIRIVHDVASRLGVTVGVPAA
ncbi:hypothetical protein [Gordonia zhaorongruii]|uniref:hypothetical protein n=1 Tax=Gordonia zhaorongruii TaxID=2597659 RepID=UPI00104E524A|nr:hypothetical protein [Gordonia zhaorongruii]